MAYRKIHDDFWTDPDLEDLEPEQKFFYLYLITNPRVNQIGLYEFSLRRAAFETGYSIDRVSELLKYFEKAGKVVSSEETKEILVVNFYYHNKSSSPKMKIHVESLLKEVKDTSLIQYISGMDTASYSMDTTSQEEEEKEEHVSVSPSRNDRPISDLSKRDFDFSDGADEDELIDRLTFRVYKMIAQNIPETHKHMRDATISKWRDPIRLMKTSDELSLHEIFELCQFATEDDFWSTTVSSTSGMRKNLAEIQKSILKQQKINNQDLTREEMLDEVSLHGNRKVSDYKMVDVNGKKRYRYEQ